MEMSNIQHVARSTFQLDQSTVLPHSTTNKSLVQL